MKRSYCSDWLLSTKRLFSFLGYVCVTKYSMDGPSSDFPELIAKVRYEPQSRNGDTSCQNLYMPKGLAKSFGLSLGDRAQICSLQDIKHLPEPSSRQLKIYYSTEVLHHLPNFHRQSMIIDNELTKLNSELLLSCRLIKLP